MREQFDFFFIHTYKNLGTTVYNSLPRSYRRRYYGQQTPSLWMFKNQQRLNYIVPHWVDNKKSVDHFSLEMLLKMEILCEDDFHNRKFIGIVRNPIDRFLSVCNFKNMSPAEFIDRILKNSSKNFESLSTARFTQEDSFRSPLPIDLTLILMSEKELIKNWFAEHGVYINLDLHLNTSVKRYTVNDITEDQLEIIKDYFSLDIKLYEELKAANGILNFKNHTHVSFS